jgi:hypothetical protein
MRPATITAFRAIVAAASVVLLLGADGGGCSNPNAVGVQSYGSIVGRVLDATTNKPVPDALVSVGALYTATTDTQGGFLLPSVPIGLQTVVARSPGYTPSEVRVNVQKDVAVSAGYIRLAPAVPYGATPVPTLPPPAVASPSPAPPASAAAGTPAASAATASPAVTASPASTASAATTASPAATSTP